MKVNWIRCDEGPPKEKGSYWVYSPLDVDEVCVAYWDQRCHQDHHEWWISDLSIRPGDIGAPTHYAKAVLPDPPAEMAELSG